MSTPDENEARLPEAAARLLEGWPAPAKSALEWEDAANRTVSRIRETEVGSTPDDLLEPPLPAAEGEPRRELVAPVETDESLAAIARAVVQDPGQSMKAAAREALLVAERGRPSPPPPAGRMDDPGPALVRTAAPGRDARPARVSGAPFAPRPAAPQLVHAVHEAAARSEAPYRDPRAPSPWAGRAAFLGGLLALAAGAALYLASVRREAALALAPAPTEQVAATGAGADRVPEAVPSPPAQPTTAAVPSAGPLLALDDLRPADKGPPVTAPKSEAPHAKDSLSFRVQNTPKGANKLVLEEQPEPAAGAVTDSQPAAPTPTTSPDQPSVGAVQAAVGAVMAGARSCLAGQESGSRATVTFGSDGRVRSVAVSGPASGTPAEGCLKSALGGARVPPFSERTFTFAMTVRPP
jgi:hypothetical protein